ncbi:hypothetical protein D3C76_992470 [compost metagenome]
MLPGLASGERLTSLQCGAGLRQCPQDTAQGRDELSRLFNRPDQFAELAQLRQFHRHHRFPRAQVFIDLDRVGGEGQRHDLERKQANVHGVEVVRQGGIRDFTFQDHIRAGLEVFFCLDDITADQQDQVLREGLGDPLDQVQIEPFGNDAVVANDFSVGRVPVDLVGTLAEETELAGIADHLYVAVLALAVLFDPVGCRHQQIGPAHQGDFKVEQFLGNVAETFVVIHAVIDQGGVGDTPRQRKPVGMLDDAIHCIDVR